MQPSSTDTPNGEAVSSSVDNGNTADHHQGIATNTLRANAPAPRARTKRGRSDLTTEETIMLLREVFAADAHVAPHGSKLELFYKAAHALTVNEDFHPSLDGKSVRDRYERLQRSFNKKDKKDALLSGVGGEVSEADEMLSQMEEARAEQAAQRIERRDEINRREQRKLAAGARIVERSMSADAGTDEGSEDNSEAERETGSDVGEDVVSARRGAGSVKGKRRRVNHGAKFEGEMDRFGALLRDGDRAQRDLDEKKLALEERRIELEEKRRMEEREERRLDREAEREERTADRASRNQVDIEKFKMMMDILKGQGK